MNRGVCRAGLVALAMLGGLFRVEAQLDQGTTAKGFRLPEYDEKGQLKTLVFGDFAEVLSASEVNITNLKIETFRNGALDMRVSSPQCAFDRQRNLAQSAARVRMVRDKMIITGEGFTYSQGDQRFEIHKDVRVVLRETRKHKKTRADEETKTP